jgi:hypothetical protein
VSIRVLFQRVTAWLRWAIISAKRSLPAYDLGSTEGTTMTDSTAEAARLMKVTEAIVIELTRQGVAEALADLGFDPTALARAAIRAADGEVIRFPGGRDQYSK